MITLLDIVRMRLRYSSMKSELEDSIVEYIKYICDGISGSALSENPSSVFVIELGGLMTDYSKKIDRLLYTKECINVEGTLLNGIAYVFREDFYRLGIDEKLKILDTIIKILDDKKDKT